MKLLLHHLNLACGAALLLACVSLTPARTEPSPAPLQSPANADRSKYAVIISGASGEFIKPLAAKGRVIVTATRSGQETNATRFMEYFLAALKATDADADQDGHISVLEAFNYANRLTAEFYTRAGRLATEHALLDDNGDGVGHQKMEGGDGLLARATYLDSLSVAQAATNVATAKLLKDRSRLESEIAQLIGRKSSMQEAQYEAELEKLFIELAKVNRAIKQGVTPATEE